MQTKLKLKWIWSDKGTEFVNALWSQYLKENRIIHETMAPYSSAANGVAERTHCTELERTCCMLCNRNLPNKYWGEACATAVYLMDFVLSVRHPEKTPYELWFKRRLDIAHLRPFGCIAYAKVPDPLSGGKLADRLIKCVIIGYFGRDG